MKKGRCAAAGRRTSSIRSGRTLARAALLSSRVGLERARATVREPQSDRTAGGPCLPMAAGCWRPTKRCSSMRPTSGSARVLNSKFATPAVQSLFAAGADGRSLFSKGGSIPVRRTRTREAFVVHVVPNARMGTRRLFGRRTPALRHAGHSATRARRRKFFRRCSICRPPKARVAAMIAEGSSVDIMAQGVVGEAEHDPHAAQGDLFEDRTNRQAELVSLLRLPPSR